jgi:hypothetical protein
MSIDVHWDNEQHTVARWVFADAWTWEDFEAVQARFLTMLHNIDHTVDVIVDMRAISSLPPDSFAHYKRLERDGLPNRGRVVVVTTCQFIRSMVMTFNQTFKQWPIRFTLAETIEEAQDILALPGHRGSESI